MSLHPELANEIAARYGERLSEPPRLTHDALTLAFDNGLRLQARFASAEEYSIQWTAGNGELRIDTAPLHPELATFPNHFHGADGAAHADPFTRPGAAPRDNLIALIDALLAKPHL